MKFFKLILLLCLLLFSNFLNAQQLIFRSGFEPNSVGTPADAHTNITGVDNSVQAPNDWVNDFANNPKIGVFRLYYGGGVAEDAYARIVDDPTKPGNKILKYAVLRPNADNNDGTVHNFKTRIQADIYENVNLPEMYYKIRMYLHQDIQKLSTLSGGIEYFTLFEFWNDPNWVSSYKYKARVSVNLVVSGGKFYLKTRAAYYPVGSSSETSMWTQTATNFEIPFAKWMTCEIYFKDGDASNGRFYLAITPEGEQKTVLFDVKNYTISPENNEPLNGLTHFNPFKVYTPKEETEHILANNGKFEIYWDDFELWTSFPNDSIAPTAPTNLSASNIASNKFTLTWNRSTDNYEVAGYDVFKDGVLEKSVADTTTQITGLTPSTTYAITVKAKDFMGNVSDASSVLNVTTNPADAIPPTAPTGLNSSNITETSFTVNWNASTDNIGVTGYNVYKDGILYTSVTGLTANITGLNPNTTYAITVKAKDIEENLSDASSILNVTTTQDVTAPSAPTGLKSTDITSSSFTLSWNVATDNIGVTGYDVFKDGVLYSSVTTTSVNVTALTSSTTYSMQVKAKDAAGNLSDFSIALNVTTLSSTAWVPPSGMWAEWKFDSTATDGSGNLRDATLVGATYVPGKFGYALNFDGNDHVVLPTSTEIGSDTGSVSLWFKTNNDYTDSGIMFYGASVTGGNGFGDQNELHVGLSATENANIFIMGTTRINQSSTASYRDSTWHHLVATWNIEGNAKLFIDNNQVVSIVHDANNFKFSSIFRLGVTATTSRYFVGQIDQVRYYDRELDTADIAKLYNERIEDFQAPTAPTGLSASAITQSSFTLSWNASTDNVGVTGYDVYKDGVLYTSVTGTTANITGLNHSTTYVMTVTAKDAANNVSNASTPLNVTTSTPDTQAPTAPTNLTASNITGSSFTLSWDASTDNVGVTGYNVFKDGTQYTSVTGLTANITGLTAYKTYAINVYAVDAASNVSNASSTKYVTTYILPKLSGAIIGATGGANGSNVKENVFDGDTSTFYEALVDTEFVGLDFGAPKKIRKIRFHARSLNEYRMNGGKFQASNTADFSSGVINLISINQNPPNVWVDTNIVDTTKYRYVRYKSPTNGYCNVADIQFFGADTIPPTQPTALSAGTITANSISITWAVSTDNIGSVVYDIFVNGILDTSVSVNSVTITGLNPSTSYSITIKAKDEDGNYSIASTVLNVQTTGTSMAAAATLDNVRVVPNPYNSKGMGVTQNKISFYKLTAICTIRIFTESGELVKTIEHNSGNGEEHWDMKTEGSKTIVSGIYVANIKDKKGHVKNVKFVVVR